MQPSLPLQCKVWASHLSHFLTRVGEGWSRMNHCKFLSALPITVITANVAFSSHCVLHNSAREVTDPAETCNSYVAGIFHNFTLFCIVKYHFPKCVVLWFRKPKNIFEISFWRNWSWNRVLVTTSAYFLFKSSDVQTFTTTKKMF